MKKIREKTLADRRKSILALASHVEAFGAAVDAKLKERFARLVGEGEPLPDWRLGMELMIRDLYERWDEIAAIEEREGMESSREAKDRRQRDATARVVHDLLRDLKRALDSALNKSEVTQVFPIKGEIPRRAGSLELPAEETVRRLRKWKPSSGSGPVPFEAERWAEPLERETTTLKDLGDQVHLSQQKIVLLRANRRRALQAYDDDFVEYATVIAGYFQLAGFAKQARSIRPSKKYRGRTQAEIRQLGKAPRKTPKAK
jgi:hypothetical protein